MDRSYKMKFPLPLLATQETKKSGLGKSVIIHFELDHRETDDEVMSQVLVALGAYEFDPKNDIRFAEEIEEDILKGLNPKNVWVYVVKDDGDEADPIQ